MERRCRGSVQKVSDAALRLAALIKEVLGEWRGVAGDLKPKQEHVRHREYHLDRRCPRFAPPTPHLPPSTATSTAHSTPCLGGGETITSAPSAHPCFTGCTFTDETCSINPGVHAGAPSCSWFQPGCIPDGFSWSRILETCFSFT